MSNDHETPDRQPQITARNGHAADETGYDGSVLSSPTAKMDLLRSELSARGLSSEGMSWRLLMLEWKYDLAVLFGNIGRGMLKLDRRFNGFGLWH